MRTHCPANERVKREYLIYLKEAQRYSEPTIDGVATAIAIKVHLDCPRSAEPAIGISSPTPRARENCY